MCDLRSSSIPSVVVGGAGPRLFSSERDSDVAVRVEWEGGRWHFPGHSLVLGTMSEVLRTMLDTDMLEKSSRVITIRDSSPRAVKHFLRYLYMGMVEFNGWQEATSLLKIAHKYGVQPLVSLSESYLTGTLVVSNTCSLLDLARTYSLKALQRQAQAFVLDAGFVVSASEGFFELRARSLEYVLASEYFNVEDEGSVLTCLREWAVCECSRRCMPLSRSNVLAAMEPFFKFIRWTQIPEAHRTFVPRPLAEKHVDSQLPPRKSFHVPPSIQYHTSLAKFVVELGAYHKSHEDSSSHLNCLKFGVSNHSFLVGFRIIGLFRISSLFPGPSCLALSKEDNKVFLQFNLNSLTWTKGSAVGRDVWREMIAYLPYPVRIDPFGTYNVSIRCSSGRSKELLTAKWPRTRLDNEAIHTELGVINFRAYGPSYGVTQLFLLPAPQYRSVCND